MAHDFASVVEIQLLIPDNRDTNQSLSVSFHNLLIRLPNLRRLNLYGYDRNYVTMTPDQVYFMVPHHVEHLYMHQRSYQRMREIANKLNFLTTITYNYQWNVDYTLADKIFHKREHGWIYYCDSYRIYIWLNTVKKREAKSDLSKKSKK